MFHKILFLTKLNLCVVGHVGLYPSLLISRRRSTAPFSFPELFQKKNRVGVWFTGNASRPPLTLFGKNRFKIYVNQNY